MSAETSKVYNQGKINQLQEAIKGGQQRLAGNPPLSSRQAELLRIQIELWQVRLELLQERTPHEHSATGT